MHHWHRKAVYWLRKLGGKLDLKSDRDGPYWLLRGISAVFLTAATLSLVAISPSLMMLSPKPDLWVITTALRLNVVTVPNLVNGA